MTNKRAHIVVLGDIGHSPRMGYHAMSLSKEGYQVDIFGYEGSSPHLDLLFDPNITLRHLKKVPQFISGRKSQSYGITTIILRIMNYQLSHA